MIFEKQIIDFFKSNLYVRQDPPGDVFYYTHTDFPGLSASPFEFLGRDGQRLERVMALESREGTRAWRRVEEGLSRSFSGDRKSVV